MRHPLFLVNMIVKLGIESRAHTPRQFKAQSLQLIAHSKKDFNPADISSLLSATSHELSAFLLDYQQ